MKTNLCVCLAAVSLALFACAENDGADLTVPAGNADPQAAASAGSPERALAAQIAIMEQRVAATNARDWNAWEALHTADAVRTAPELEQPLRGSGAMRAAIETLSAAFPDYHLELTQAFGQGEWLAVRLHTTGTMTGPLLLSDGSSVPPTNLPIEQDWAAMVRFEGEQIAEFHEYYDQLLLMQQLGLLAP